MKPIYLALMAPMIGTAGQILLKSSMNRIGKIGPGQISSPVALAVKLASDPMLVGAVVLYIFGFLLWLMILSQMELSKAYPIVALSYCLVTLASWLIFGEHISALRWLGITTICIGVVIVGFS